MSMFSLRIPKDLKDWLDIHVPRGNLTEFIIESVRQRITAIEREKRAQSQIPVDEQPLSEMEESLAEMYAIAEGDVRAEGYMATGHAEYKQPFMYMHRIYRPDSFQYGDHGTYDFQRFSDWLEKKSQIDEANYVKNLLSQPEETRTPIFLRILKRADVLWRDHCPGNYLIRLAPDWTLGDYLERLADHNRREFTISEIAGDLGITYAQAHNKVRPLLENEGYRCVRASLPKREQSN